MQLSDFAERSASESVTACRRSMLDLPLGRAIAWLTVHVRRDGLKFRTNHASYTEGISGR